MLQTDSNADATFEFYVNVKINIKNSFKMIFHC